VIRAVEVGASATQYHTVQAADCASNWGNDLPVLATPVLLWLAETTAMRVVDAFLDVDEMTVGYGHDAKHLAPTPAGWTVRIEACLTRVEGRLLHFDVTARDDQETIFTGVHVRAVVGSRRFIDRLHAKASAAAAAS
jgi:fluoroacetyl-CoA thioesterase